MSGADRHKRVKSIFLQVCELPKGERAAFLDSACGGDLEMRAEIEEMVGFEDENPAFLEDATTDPPVPKVESALRRDLPKTVTGSDGRTDEERLAELSKRLEQRLNEIEGAANVQGRYVLEGEIGRGGMGAVLRVFDTDLHRKLAMKVVLGQRGETDQGPALATLLRFIEEAQVTGQLDHPGVVPVHELGVDDDGRMYFTMRLVKGIHLGEVMKLARAGSEGWNRTRALGVVLKVCETLAYAHSKGVVHRDLKPANVMVGRFGETYVMDWGIARVLGKPATKGSPERTSGVILPEHLLEGSPALTKEGGVLGTPYYMPVEQARGVLEDIGPHTDVYAAGAMLYQLLTGIRPYETPDAAPNVAAVLAGILRGPPVPVHRLAPREAPELLAICEKAMAYEWRERYPSMVEMAEDLRAFLEGRVVQAHATDYVTRFRKWVARNRLLAGTLAAMVAISVISVSVFLWQQDRRLRAVRAQQVKTALARDEAHDNEVRALANAAAARRQSYEANIAAADASLRATEIREAKRLLELCPPELRRWEWAHLALYADTSEAVLAQHAGPVRAIARQIGGPLVASSSDDGALLLRDVTREGDPVVLASLEGAASHLRFVPGGRLLTVEGTRVRIFDVARNELVSAVELPVEGPTCATSDRDGNRLAIGADDYTVRVFEAESGRSLAVFPGHEGTVLSVAFGAGNVLASGSEDGTVRLWDLGKEEPGAVLDLEDNWVQDVAFSPDGRDLAAATAGGNVWLSHEASKPRLLHHHEGAVYAIAFAADGRRLASASFDKTVRVFDVDANRLEVTLRGHDRPVHCVAFDVTGRTLVTGGEDRTVREWNVESSRAVTVQRGPGDFVSAVAAGGERLAIGTLNGAIEVLDAAGLRPVRHLDGEEDGVFSLAFSPDDRRLAAGYESEGVRVFDVETLEPVHEFASHGLSVTCVAFAPDGRLLASGSHDETVHVEFLDGDEEVQVLQGSDGAVTGVAFAPDGRLLAATSASGRLSIWRVEDWTLALAAEGEDALTSLAWSPDGRRIVAGGEDAHVRVFDAESGDAIGVLEGHDQRVSQIAFAPDGLRFVSASFDGTLRVWDVDSKRPLLSLRGHDGPVSSVCFAAEGADIVSGGYDGTARVWRTRAP